MIAGVAACLALLELGVRIYSSLWFPRMMILDDRLGWKHAGGVSRVFSDEDSHRFIVTQNSYGHRGKQYSFQRTVGKHRVLILGDSFTEGVHVSDDEVFSAQLETLATDIEVINAGIGGYGTVQQYLYLVSEGLRFNPHLVLLMFFDNDLSDNCLSYYPGFGPRPYATLSGGQVRIIETLDPTQFLRFTVPVPFQVTLSRYSYFYYFVNTSVYQRLFSKQMKDLRTRDMAMTESCGTYEIFYWLAMKMKLLLESRNAGFALVLIPTREDVDQNYSVAQAPIVEFCEESGLRCLQLLGRFARERAAGVRAYFKEDIHWTKAGHKIAAEEIHRFLRVDGGRGG